MNDVILRTPYVLGTGHLLEGGGLVQMGRGSYLFVYLKMRGCIRFCISEDEEEYLSFDEENDETLPR